ncbi:MAG TPA: hypothetical protein VL137_00440, partial [Polyangiaceae bacterium]|nr:hypothetical protein [Polyangiaceae bacterium]
MNQRSLERTTLFAALLIAGFAAWGTANAADDSEGSSGGPCKAKTFNFAVVAKACKDGGAKGRDKVKTLMKAAREKAKAKGIKIDDSAVKC